MKTLLLLALSGLCAVADAETFQLQRHHDRVVFELAPETRRLPETARQRAILAALSPHPADGFVCDSPFQSVRLSGFSDHQEVIRHRLDGQSVTALRAFITLPPAAGHRVSWAFTVECFERSHVFFIDPAAIRQPAHE